MRLIDADWLIQHIEYWRDIMVDTYGKNDEYATCLAEVLMKIDDAPTVDVPERNVGEWIDPAAQPAPRWIPVTDKEKLPKSGIPVLVTRKFLGGRVHYGSDVIQLNPDTYVEIAHFNGDRWVAESEDAKIGKHPVVAWMPLPTPWKGESDDRTMSL